jgi:hypothetical protein
LVDRGEARIVELAGVNPCVNERLCPGIGSGSGIGLVVRSTGIVVVARLSRVLAALIRSDRSLPPVAGCDGENDHDDGRVTHTLSRRQRRGTFTDLVDPPP